MICKCTNELFKIDILDCDGCEYNGAHDGEEYIYDQKEIDERKLERTESHEDGQCEFGCCWDAGCYMFTCNSCGNKTNLAMMTD